MSNSEALKPADMLVPGVDFDFGRGVTLCVPPLTIGHLMQYQKGIADLNTNAALDATSIQTMMNVSLASLKRNYPSITEEALGGIIDLGNIHELMVCVLDVGGVERKKQLALKTQARAAEVLQS